MISKFAGPVMIASLAMGSSVGVSGAYFTDAQSSAKSYITAGSLDITGAYTQKVNVDDLMPGDTGSREMTFKVDGTDSWFRIVASTTKDDLAGNLNFTYALVGSSTGPIEMVPASGGGETSVVPIAPGSYKVVVSYKMNESAGDQFQGKKYEGYFNFETHQAKNVPLNPYLGVN